MKTDETLVSGKDCMAESAESEMQFVQANYTGTGKRSYYHMIQSFSTDDKVTPELAHEIGLQMAEHCYPGHQVLVATHLDKKHMHCSCCNHFSRTVYCLCSCRQHSTNVHWYYNRCFSSVDFRCFVIWIKE